MSLPLNPALSKLPVYQPGRPIEEVARELVFRRTMSSSWLRTKILGPSPPRWLRCNAL
jgi:hypothetical protein